MGSAAFCSDGVEDVKRSVNRDVARAAQHAAAWRAAHGRAGKVGTDTCVRGNAANGNDGVSGKRGRRGPPIHDLEKTSTHLQTGESSVSHLTPEQSAGALKISLKNQNHPSLEGNGCELFWILGWEGYANDDNIPEAQRRRLAMWPPKLFWGDYKKK